MELVEIHIIDFKSIKSLHIKIKNNILCLVGKNESGKSSVIEAISYLNLSKPFNNLSLTNKASERYDVAMPYLIGRFTIKRAELSTDSESISQEYFAMETLEKLVKISKSTKNNLILEVERWGSSSESIQLSIVDAENNIAINLKDELKDKRKVNSFLEKFAYEYIPTIELFTNDELNITPASIEDLKSGKPEHESMRRLLFLAGCKDFDIFNKVRKSPQACERFSTKLSQLFKKHYLQDPNLSFKIAYNNNRVSLIVQEKIKGKDDEFYEIEERSPGFQYFFAFIVNKHYLTASSKAGNIFLLDEPGNNLHPQGSKDLLNTFVSISNSNSKILYTTHNLFLILRDSMDSLQYVRKNNSENGTYIDNKVYRDNFEILRKELGVYLNDSFLVGDTNIIVDGATEKYALPRVFNYFSSKNPKFPNLQWVNIYSADGTTEIKSAIKYIDSLGLNGVVLFDSDGISKQVREKKIVAKILDTQNWDELSINDLFSDNENRDFEDIFPGKIYFDAYNQFYSSMTDIIDFKIKFEPLKHTEIVTNPIIDIVKKHYLKHRYGEDEAKWDRRDNINKIGVMRVLLDNIFKMDEKESSEALKIANLLCSELNKKINKILK